jgi:hypothetical protein
MGVVIESLCSSVGSNEDECSEIFEAGCIICVACFRRDPIEGLDFGYQQKAASNDCSRIPYQVLMERAAYVRISIHMPIKSVSSATTVEPQKDFCQVILL